MCELAKQSPPERREPGHFYNGDITESAFLDFYEPYVSYWRSLSLCIRSFHSTSERTGVFSWSTSPGLANSAVQRVANVLFDCVM